MTGKTHLICTVTAYTAIAVIYKEGITVPSLGGSTTIMPLLGIPAAALGSLMPDIDIENSKMSNRIPFFKGMLKHRGITHTLLFVILAWLGIQSHYSIVATGIIGALMGLLIGITCAKGKILFTSVGTAIAFTSAALAMPGLIAALMFGLSVGWAGHIFEDLLNKKGCPILFPISKSHVHFLSIKTRSWQETIFLILWEFVWIGYLGGKLSGKF